MWSARARLNYVPRSHSHTLLTSPRGRQCGHEFHAESLAMWLRIQATCPLCKARLAPSPVPPAPPTRGRPGPSSDAGGSNPAEACPAFPTPSPLLREDVLDTSLFRSGSRPWDFHAAASRRGHSGAAPAGPERRASRSCRRHIGREGAVCVGHLRFLSGFCGGPGEDAAGAANRFRFGTGGKFSKAGA